MFITALFRTVQLWKELSRTSEGGRTSSCGIIIRWRTTWQRKGTNLMSDDRDGPHRYYTDRNNEHTWKSTYCTHSPEVQNQAKLTHGNRNMEVSY